MKQVCFICGKEMPVKKNRWRLSDRRKGLYGAWELAECDSCGVISMNPMLTEEQLKDYYSHYPNNVDVNLSKGIGSRYPIFRNIYHRLTGDVDPRDFVTVKKGECVLDYGCGHADYLKDFHEKGIKISGAEIAGYVVESCQSRGYDVHQVNNYSRIPFEDNMFNVIYLMQVFEHLRDPHEFLSELNRTLKIDGELYMAIPNSASVWRKIFKDNWVSGWFAPFHLFHYNSANLTKLANEHGFGVIDSWSRTPIDWFILNLKAYFYPNDNKLENNKCWLNNRWAKYILMIILRIIETPIIERDCLVLHFKKISNDI